jgi:hypothetical protein
MPYLPSGEGGVLCSGGLLVEKMNIISLFFFSIGTIGFFNSEQFFLKDQIGSRF